MRRPQMSVLVATAYMDEAEGFEWLIAMDAGTVLATGSPHDLKMHGNDTLEQAFIALFLEGKRRGHHTLVVPPRRAEDGVAAIEARGLTRALVISWPSTTSVSHRARRNLRVSGLQRLR